MATRHYGSNGEPLTKAGEVLLSHNHMALLHGLLDRPDSKAASIADWLRASMPYLARYRGYPSIHVLEKAIQRVHPSWVRRERVGRCIQVTLLPRGRAIIDRVVPARVLGLGRYEGLPKARAS